MDLKTKQTWRISVIHEVDATDFTWAVVKRTSQNRTKCTVADGCDDACVQYFVKAENFNKSTLVQKKNLILV